MRSLFFVLRRVSLIWGRRSRDFYSEQVVKPVHTAFSPPVVFPQSDTHTLRSILCPPFLWDVRHNHWTRRSMTMRQSNCKFRFKTKVSHWLLLWWPNDDVHLKIDESTEPEARTQIHAGDQFSLSRSDERVNETFFVPRFVLKPAPKTSCLSCSNAWRRLKARLNLFDMSIPTSSRLAEATWSTFEKKVGGVIKGNHLLTKLLLLLEQEKNPLLPPVPKR